MRGNHPHMPASCFSIPALSIMLNLRKWRATLPQAIHDTLRIPLKLETDRLE